MRTIRSQSRLGLSAAALLSAALLPASPLLAQSTLELIPENAHIAVTIPGLDEVTTRLDTIQQAIPAIPLAEAVQNINEMLEELGPGYDASRPAVIVIPNVMMIAPTAQMGQPAFVALVPVSNYDSFVENMGGSGSDAITQIFPPDSPPMHVKKLGDYAALSPNQVTIQGYQPGNQNSPAINQLPDALEQTLDGSAVGFYINLEALSPIALPFVTMGLDTQINQIEMQLSGTDMDDATIDQTIGSFKLFGAAVKQLLNDANAAVFAINLTDDAATIDTAIQMKSGSFMTSIFPGDANLEGAFGVLPNRPSVSTLAIDTKALNLGLFYETMLNVAPEFDESFIGHEHWIPMAKQMKRYSVATYPPAPNTTASGLTQTVANMILDDPEAGRQAVANTIDSVDGHEQAMGSQGIRATYEASQRPNAGTAEGLAYDQYSVAMQMPPEVAAELGPMAGFVQMTSNYSGFMTTTEDSLIATMVPDENLLAEAIRATRQAAPDPEFITNARTNLPAGLAAEAYLSPSGLLQVLNNVLPATGMPAIEDPGDLKPLALGLGIDQNSLVYRIHIPYDTAAFIANEAQNAMGLMMGGGMTPPTPPTAPQQIPGAPPRSPF
ncbi:hypothetical protein [Mucisphaera sp.]|uniref:hypothetical protein n=1 Tax=Mucisphaera sp. TaxID=2913024 RepID=UPI003D0A8560